MEQIGESLNEIESTFNRFQLGDKVYLWVVPQEPKGTVVGFSCIQKAGYDVEYYVIAVDWQSLDEKLKAEDGMLGYGNGKESYVFYTVGAAALRKVEE